MTCVTLHWHRYRYFPYERDLARKEVVSLLEPRAVRDADGGLVVETDADPRVLRRLVYFSGFTIGDSWTPTLQHLLEGSGSTVRQATRYSVHGLHEYKGKFNPQVVRGVLNHLGIGEDARILDPFCGSGTTLVECTYAGIDSVGCDLNPLAVFVSSAKLQALSTPVQQLRDALERTLHGYGEARTGSARWSARPLLSQAYLEQWFTPDALSTLDSLGASITEACAGSRDFFLSIVSDLVREYSLQDPADLRIRRRKSPLPAEPLVEAFERKAVQAIASLDDAQRVAGVPPRRARACVADSRNLDGMAEFLEPFHGAVTSPPYATALPYIDTQRLSLVWLGMVLPGQLRSLDSEITGSREFGGREKTMWDQRLTENRDALPEAVHRRCATMHRLLGPQDGFRRQAVPALLYRYLASMRTMFSSVLRVLQPGAPYALLVGHNRTTLGGEPIDIDTPELLATVAESVGWRVEDRFAFQTYQRYGLHRQNAVSGETLLVLRRP